MSTDSNNVIAAKAGSQVLPAKERMESQMNADGPDSQLGINNREPSRTANPHAGIPSLRRIQPLVTSQFKSDTYALGLMPITLFETKSYVALLRKST
jgi:hypothetical protein